MSYLRAKGIVKRYGQGPNSVEALRGIDMEVPRGQWVAIMGASGSGKSTLLSVLGGLNSPTEGSYSLGEVELYQLDAEKRADFRREQMGFVFQSFHLMEYLSVLENVMLPMAPLRIPASIKRERAMEALNRVGLVGKERRLPGEISGGEQERVAIARAIVNRPSLLLADEPTGNLDSATGHRIMELFCELNAQGMTVIMATHDSRWAKMAQRTLYISDGLLLRDGESEELPSQRTLGE